MSKKKIEENERFTVLRDTREKVGQGWIFQPSLYCKGTIEQKLDTGDYSLVGHENKIVIERKATTAEIANNILEDRFVRELERLESFEFPFIVCEFSWHDVMMYPINSGIPKRLWYKLKIKSEYLRSSLMRYMIQYKVKIIFAGSAGDVVTEELFKHYIRYGLQENQ